MFADTHCHLDLEVFDSDRDAVLHRSSLTGVGLILNPGIDLQSSQKAVKLAEKYPQVFVGVGVHPNEATSWKENSLSSLKELTKNPKVVAIGEIGLDYYRHKTSSDIQKEIFINQLNLALELNLPVIIHNRLAGDDLIKILSAWHNTLVKSGSPLLKNTGVLHAYSGDRQLAEKALQMNFYIGLAGQVTYPSAHRLCELVIELPVERILVETDAPYLSPQPWRGKRNEPGYMVQIAKKIAELRNTSLEDIKDVTTGNARCLFNW